MGGGIDEPCTRRLSISASESGRELHLPYRTYYNLLTYFLCLCLVPSFSDGPSPDTPRLLNYMVENDLKATFFVVGSRAISRPQMLQYEYMAGNQISVHTWAHPQLTTRTNEEIVAELGWSKEAIRQIVRTVLASTLFTVAEYRLTCISLLRYLSATSRRSESPLTL